MVKQKTFLSKRCLETFVQHHHEPSYSKTLSSGFILLCPIGVFPLPLCYGCLFASAKDTILALCMWSLLSKSGLSLFGRGVINVLIFLLHSDIVIPDLSSTAPFLWNVKTHSLSAHIHRRLTFKSLLM